MKVLSFGEFAATPKGTLFCIIDEGEVRQTYIMLKGDVIRGDHGGPIDFFHMEPDGGYTRWGEFDYTQTFLVIEPDDVVHIVQMLVTQEIP